MGDRLHHPTSWRQGEGRVDRSVGGVAIEDAGLHVGMFDYWVLICINNSRCTASPARFLLPPATQTTLSSPSPAVKSLAAAIDAAEANADQ